MDKLLELETGNVVIEMSVYTCMRMCCMKFKGRTRFSCMLLLHLRLATLYDILYTMTDLSTSVVIVCTWLGYNQEK